MPRRAHTQEVHRGRIELDPAEARHLRDVLRLTEGDELELFDDAGRTAAATIVQCTPQHVLVDVRDISDATPSGIELTIASAIPKGERADWMIEKLSELGVARFIPLAAERSVVLPEGKNKRDRWLRIAVESAKQSRRRGVMEIAPLTRVPDVINNTSSVFHLSTASTATPISDALTFSPQQLAFLIGPEGGWSDDELTLFEHHKIAGLKLTDTILRIETAAIAAAAAVRILAIQNPRFKIENTK